MDHGNPAIVNGTAGYAAQLDRYKEVAARIFPDIPQGCLDRWSIPSTEALVLGILLDGCPRGVTVLELGKLTGVAALYFAGQPRVNRVICAGTDYRLAEELADGPARAPGSVQDLKNSDVAEAVLAEFPEERKKIELLAPAETGPSSEPEIPRIEVPAGDLLVAYIGRPQTREEARNNLELIYEANPEALVILNGCRYSRGPLVQAGVVEFMENSQRAFEFRLLGDLGPGLATSSLGIVFPERDPEAEKTLAALEGAFTRRLDPLRLLSREQELVDLVNWFKSEFEQTRKQLADMEARNANLAENYARVRDNNVQLMNERSEQGRLAGALERRLLKVPGVKKLLTERDSKSPTDRPTGESPKDAPG